jgi:ATP-dependent DNA helicase PIF1
VTDDLTPETLPAVDAESELDALPDVPVPVSFLTGSAGTGKTYSLTKRASVEGDVLLSSTTGISAVNLSAVTLNSLLRYFDLDSLRDAYLTGRLSRALHDIALDYRWLAIDEVSMMAAEALDMIYRGVEEANRYRDVRERPLGLALSGDFAQLPPVRARWVFEADVWPKFAERATRLTKVWRQDQGLFLDALNAARRGDGAMAAEILAAAGARWETSIEPEFDGTTIIPLNKQVNRFNQMALDRLNGARFTVNSRRWGKQRGEWGQNQRTGEWGIPPSADFKIGAYVMLLANDFAAGYSNGDCGHVVDVDDVAAGGLNAEKPSSVAVKLVRTGEVVEVPPLVRYVELRQEPEGWSGGKGFGEYLPEPHVRYREAASGRMSRAGWVMGQIEYFPLRLAYASTVHKSQGLSLDRVQIDFRDRFFGSPHMMYVALSRARTLAGVRLVGMREIFARNCVVDERIRPWL